MLATYRAGGKGEWENWDEVAFLHWTVKTIAMFHTLKNYSH